MAAGPGDPTIGGADRRCKDEPPPMMRLRTAAALLAVLPLLAATAAAAQRPGDRPPPRVLGTPLPETPVLGRPVAAAAATPGVAPGLVFRERQLGNPRVAAARAAAEPRLRRRFEAAGLAWPAGHVYLRAFKHDRVVELWAAPRAGDRLTLVHTYPMCDLSGRLGPKRRMGDLQVPEGFYFIDHFNPFSAYHLSLRLDYPNLSDRLRSGAQALGGDIFIHGGCGTIGCLPVEDDNVEEIYWIAVEARAAGQKLIPVHVFPTRMHDEGMRWLRDTFRPDPELAAFWDELRDVHRAFEWDRRTPWVIVARDGAYRLDPAAAEERAADDVVSAEVPPPAETEPPAETPPPAEVPPPSEVPPPTEVPPPGS
jgi:murein L,D-transpeptidase YafK